VFEFCFGHSAIPRRSFRELAIEEVEIS